MNSDAFDNADNHATIDSVGNHASTNERNEMPKISLTWSQLNRLVDVVEMEAEAQMKYPSDDPTDLKKMNRLRDRLYKELSRLNAKV